MRIGSIGIPGPGGPYGFNRDQDQTLGVIVERGFARGSIGPNVHLMISVFGLHRSATGKCRSFGRFGSRFIEGMPGFDF